MNRSQKIRFNKARKSALGGEFEKSIPVFEKISDELEESANASLAEIYGFLFDWENCLKNAGKFVANPRATYAGNVFNDMIRLIGRAANETQRWREVEEICDAALTRINAEEYETSHKERFNKVLQNLKGYAEREGKASQELIKIFGVKTAFDILSLEEKRARFNDAINSIASVRPDLNGKYEETVRHKIALANLFDLPDEATKLFIENESLQIYDFDFLIPVFKHLIKTGRDEMAWRIIENKIADWFPVDTVQIAPVVLLTDEDLKTIVDAERSLKILKTPRCR